MLLVGEISFKKKKLRETEEIKERKKEADMAHCIDSTFVKDIKNKLIFIKILNIYFKKW